MPEAGGMAFSSRGEEHLDTEERMHRKFLQNRKRINMIVNTEGKCLELVLRSREQIYGAESESQALTPSSSPCACGHSDHQVWLRALALGQSPVMCPLGLLIYFTPC